VSASKTARRRQCQQRKKLTKDTRAIPELCQIAGSNVKDRIAAHIGKQAIRQGKLSPNESQTAWFIATGNTKNRLISKYNGSRDDHGNAIFRPRINASITIKAKAKVTANSATAVAGASMQSWSKQDEIATSISTTNKAIVRGSSQTLPKRTISTAVAARSTE
jgi:hypothetical protein